MGQRSVNGAVSVFLCQTAASPDPTGLAPQCPQGGKVAGLVQAANMIEGPIVNQGIAPGQFNELIAAIRAGVAYVNVHSSKFPGGEVRGQLRIVKPGSAVSCERPPGPRPKKKTAPRPGGPRFCEA